SDFKTQTAVAAAYSLAPEQVGPDGKIKHGTMSDAAETYRIYTYAKMFSVNREQFVNDDLGAFTEIPMRMGKAYAQMQSDNIYTHLLANGTLSDTYDLCGTDHDNYISGTDSALSSTYAVNAISAALVKFMGMTDRDGHSISVMPKFLLVPPALNAVAQEVFKGSTLTGISTNKSPNINIHAGSYQVITEPRLSNAGITGYSATAWYMLADPAACETVKAFFLNGNRSPVIEQVPVAGDTLGYSWRVYGDMGVKAMDYRGIVKSAGA
ncbi:MAG: Mu-like prophage major head subunit gpT family protein, partial [Candidatus Omnitrophica bacterium]|nr:Mu-like prophage major head subunit gpT family protein [Candidatus Omnitrophota bacterium]